MKIDFEGLYMKTKLKGFTLAEVLITLTIIGVIAAITIPNLMQSWKKHEVEVKIKEAYSILSNALTMAKAENGNIDDMFESIGVVGLAYNTGNVERRKRISNFTTRYIVPYIKGSKVCGINNNGGYYQYSDDGSTQITMNCPNAASLFKWYRGVDGTTAVFTPGNAFLIRLQNGMNLYVSYGDEFYNSITFFVDINGDKGKDQIGHDIFAFSVYRTYANTLNPAGNASCAGVLWPGFYDGGFCSGLKTYKDKACSDRGWYCTPNIVRNGFKIPDDYPVKKF